MTGTESPEQFGDLEAEDNSIQEGLPNHCLIPPSTFITVTKGSKRITVKDLAYHLIEVFQFSVVDNDKLSVEKEEKAAGLESTLVLLWASANGLLREISLEDVKVLQEFLTSFAIPDNVKSASHITTNITAVTMSPMAFRNGRKQPPCHPPVDILVTMK